MIRSDTSTSTLPRFALRWVGFISSSLSIEPRSSPSLSLHEKATRSVAADFLRNLIKAVPYKVHTVLTDNGTHFKAMIERKEPFWAHAFDVACARNDIDHRLTKPKHPWTNGQVERMNRTIKEATVKRFHYTTHDQLRSHLADFVSAYNFAKRLKTLKGLTPFEYLGRGLDKRTRTIYHQSAPANQGDGSLPRCYYRGLGC